MLQLNSKNIPYQSVQVFLSLVSKSSDIAKNGKIANIEKYLQKSHTVFVDSHINEVYEVLKADKKTHFVPVLARDMTPLGIIKDADIKAYIYSNYGKALLYNLTQGSLKKIISHCGRADINDPIEKILKIYAFDDDNDAILITENEKYVGYLSSKVLLDIVNEKNIVDAKDQNPLTGLAGNRIINEFVANAMDGKEKVMMAYFDFDNFKPFNNSFREIPLVFSRWDESKSLTLICYIVLYGFRTSFSNTTHKIPITPKSFFFPKLFL